MTKNTKENNKEFSIKESIEKVGKMCDELYELIPVMEKWMDDNSEPLTIEANDLEQMVHVGEEIKVVIPKTNGGELSVHDLPEGLIFDNECISGAPKKEGIFSIKIEAKRRIRITETYLVVKSVLNKSELIKEQKETEEKFNKEYKDIYESPCTLKISSKGKFNDIIDYASKNIEWDGRYPQGIKFLRDELVSQKKAVSIDGWTGEISLSAQSCLFLWRSLAMAKGKGYHESERFIDMMLELGPQLTEIQKNIADRQDANNKLHTRLSAIDDALSQELFINDVDDEIPTDSLIRTENAIEDEMSVDTQL